MKIVNNLLALALLAITASVYAGPREDAFLAKRTKNCQGCHLENAQLQNYALDGADLSKAFLNNADLEFAKLIGANLEGADLSDAMLNYVDLTNGFLKGAKLINTQLQQATVDRARFDGTQLEGINPADTDFTKATGLTQAQKGYIRSRFGIVD